ncbi:MAG: hypothetical protein U0670_18995 [Anaerolineae bacterium]
MPKKEKTSRSVSKREMAELLADPHWVRDEELEKRQRFTGGQMYRHPNGQLLIDFNLGKGRLHFSREELIALIEQAHRDAKCF